MSEKKEKKVAILGKAANSIMLAPFDDKSWEKWGLSNTYADIPANCWDVWFELHDWEYHRRNNPTHYQWLLTDHKKPIYAFEDNYCNAPCAIRFPIEQITGMFGNLFNNDPKFRYWTNSPSYMMALAILKGATHIGIWGIDMAMTDEYAIQRPSCELMIGYCLGKGIKVTIPNESSLCKCRRLYGYETHDGDGYVEVRTRESLLKQKIGEAQAQSEQSNIHKAMFFGALQELQLRQTDPSYDVNQRKEILEQSAQQATIALDQSEKKKLILQGAIEDLLWVKNVFLT